MDHSAFVGLWKSNVSGRRWGVFFKKNSAGRVSIQQIRVDA